MHRAELLRVSGPCDRAEEEALLACDELRPWMRREFGWPLVELGNIRLRKGDLVGAEDAFMAAHERAWSAQPGLALLRLAQGDVQAASRLIADAITHPFDVPWKERPPSGELRLAPLLEAQAEIAAAEGDLPTARRAAERVEPNRRPLSQPVAARRGAARRGPRPVGRRRSGECQGRGHRGDDVVGRPRRSVRRRRRSHRARRGPPA